MTDRILSAPVCARSVLVANLDAAAFDVDDDFFHGRIVLESDANLPGLNNGVGEVVRAESFGRVGSQRAHWTAHSGDGCTVEHCPAGIVGLQAVFGVIHYGPTDGSLVFASFRGGPVPLDRVAEVMVFTVVVVGHNRFAGVLGPEVCGVWCWVAVLFNMHIDGMRAVARTVRADTIDLSHSVLREGRTGAEHRCYGQDRQERTT